VFLDWSLCFQFLLMILLASQLQQCSQVLQLEAFLTALICNIFEVQNGVQRFLFLFMLAPNLVAMTCRHLVCFDDIQHVFGLSL
jgi:hypothetical protein